MRLTKEIVQQRLDDDGRGLVIVGEFTRAVDKSDFSCSFGHRFKSAVHSVLAGCGCPKCSRTSRLTTEEVNKQIEHIGLVVIGEYVGSVFSRNTFACKEGHILKSTLDNVRKRSGCVFCRKNLRVDEIDAEKKKLSEQLAERGITIVGEFSGLKRGKVAFSCSFGHFWETSLDSVLRKTGCPACSKRVALTKEDINNRLVSRGISMVCAYKGNANMKHTFSCAYGHEWDAKVGSVLHKSGCPICSGNVAHTTEKLNMMLIDRGIQLNGPYVGRVGDKQDFLCRHGHEWSAKTNNVLNGSGCPVCNPGGFKPGIPGVLYFLEVDNYRLGSPVYKVGITNGDVAKRVSGMGATKGTTITVKRCIEFASGFAARAMESELHKKFAEYRYNGNVSLVDNGHTELFTLDISKLV
jgi:hypothetical protein